VNHEWHSSDSFSLTRAGRIDAIADASLQCSGKATQIVANPMLFIQLCDLSTLWKIFYLFLSVFEIHDTFVEVRSGVLIWVSNAIMSP
jgi:hypothetical protein